MAIIEGLGFMVAISLRGYYVVGRFMSTDPLALDFAAWSTYHYVLDNPVRLVDPDGREPDDVIIAYNKSSGRMTLIDLDHYDPALPNLVVSAHDYQQGGVRDDEGDLTHNQILVIENVFSGGHIDDDNSSFVTNGSDNELEIPNGDYDLLDNTASTTHPDWYRVDPQDGKKYNDQYDVEGVTNASGTARNGFRLHTGRLSWGCITICKTEDNDRATEWSVLTSILQSTSTSVVKDRRGRQGYNPFSWSTHFGTLHVSGSLPDDAAVRLNQTTDGDGSEQ